jgi:hypothetical protein
MPLLDKDTSVMDTLGKTELVDTRLQPALQEIFDLESQDVIELHTGLVKHTNSDQTTNEGISFEKSLWIFLVESEKLTIEELAFSRFQNANVMTYRAARRILERVSWTRQTSRLFRRPYSPTIFNSESLLKAE